MKDEASYVCDSCGEEIVVPIDLSAGPSRSTSRTVRFAAAQTSFTSKSMRMEKCESGHHENDDMLPLYHDPCFTFRFADDRIIPRFHLEGVEKGRHVSVIKIDPESGERLGLLATATVGDGGWVDLPQPIIVRAGEAFIAVPILFVLRMTRTTMLCGR